MTIFIVLCVAMTLAALLWVIRPLLRSPPPSESTDPAEVAARAAAEIKRRRDRTGVIVLLCTLVPVLSVSTYLAFSNFKWNATTASATGSPHGMDENDIQAMIGKLEAQLSANPQDLQGWMMLGRSYTQVDRFGRAADAYEQAYKISGGNDVDVIASLAEALALNDEASLASGRAGQLFETALAKSPTDARSLWYSGMAAVQTGKLSVARDRFQLLLEQKPPERIRTLLEQQIQDLNAQLQGTAGSVLAADKAPSTVPPAPAAKSAVAGGRVIEVSVNISSDLLRQLPGPTPVFILARDPAGGPPLAVERRLSAELPVSVRLDQQSAMVEGRSLDSAAGKVQIVARIARSGTPQAQPGDFFGEAEYDFSQGAAGVVKITIDRTVPASNAAATTMQPPVSSPPVSSPSASSATVAGARLLKVSVSIAPALASKLPSSAPIFVLARDPSGGGPPLAVQKRAASELPMVVELNESSAMVAGRSIANVSRVQVVARVSRSGSPMAQSGDLFGEAEYDFSKGATGSLKIVIDRTTP